MFQWFSGLLTSIKEFLFQKQMEVAVIGLQNAGKSTLVQAISEGRPVPEALLPTIGYNVKSIKKGGLSIKVWDCGGQQQLRPQWVQYCSEASCILYVVDSSMLDLEESLRELRTIVAHPQLAEIPLLVLGNKNDLDPHLSVGQLVAQLSLKSITGREVACYSISAKEARNMDSVINFLIKHAERRRPSANSASGASPSTPPSPLVTPAPAKAPPRRPE
ncbi:putative ADP-ribosylation factor family protein [Paratrimastix pyriformis]|uniref:ADP-ribosylation factor family protein n=1 Tax=Paratrimastix pyriformis TaxID=342808 RepID=A0ABQ8U671_9EUKA|nr:putative ADP-ribosylation factor family protein [Paratrimastix pyriformis]QXF29090.1 Arl8 [Paratrimastix pyriformis]